MDIVTRQEWGARPPEAVSPIVMPTRELWLHHTADNNHGADGVQAIQRFHMDSRGWSDIAYSFLVDVDGTVYEGRGAGMSGAHTRGHNSVSHAICAIGNYQTILPPSGLLVSVARLVAHGHERGWWPSKLSGGHRDVGQTSCPGQRLYERIGDINRMALSSGKDLDVLQRGDKGPRVRTLQARLTWYRDDIELEWDGVYGPATEAAVKKFQRATGIFGKDEDPDGIWTGTEWFVLLRTATDAGRVGGGDAAHTHDFAAKNHTHSRFASVEHSHRATVEMT